MAYIVPTPADLKAIYPAFAAVDDATILAWINRVNGRYVDESWNEADFPDAIIAAAAHHMARHGIPGIATSSSVSYAAAGVTGFKSGTVDITLDPGMVARSTAGGWESTSYGLDYLELLRRRGHGMGVTNVGCGCA